MNFIRHKIIYPYIVILTFLLPLKFASIAVMPEVPLLYSSNLLAWVLVAWPTPIFTLSTGILLLAVLFFFPFPKPDKIIFPIPASWVLLSFISLLGYINASAFDYPVLETLHFFSIAAYITSLYVVLSYKPEWRYPIMTAIICGVIISCLNGWEQLLSGFNETREFVQKEEMKSGVRFSADFINRLMQNRVFANFSLCNSFAAHLILTLPFCFWGIWKICGKIDPPRLTRLIFLSVFTCISLPILYYTGSRSALASIGGAFIFMLILIPINKKIKIAAGMIVIIAIIAFFTVLTSGRGFSSIVIRFDYYQSALKSFIHHPLAGTGWGDFFSEYPRYKQYHKAVTEVPHTPHNAILAFASQTGILGLIASLVCFVYPVFSILSVLKYNTISSHFLMNTDIKNEYQDSSWTANINTRICNFKRSTLSMPSSSQDDCSRFFVWAKLYHPLSSSAGVLEYRTKNDNKVLSGEILRTGSSDSIQYFRYIVEHYGTEIVVLAGWLAWSLHAMTDINIQIPGSVCTAGALLLVCMIKEKQNSKVPEIMKFSEKNTKIIKAVFYILQIVTIVILLIQGSRVVMGDYAFFNFKELCDPRNKTPQEYMSIPTWKFKELFDKCIKYIPYSPFPYATAANFLASHGRFATAEQYAKEAVKRAPERASFYYTLSCIQIRLGKRKEAMQNLEKAHSLFPANPKYTPHK